MISYIMISTKDIQRNDIKKKISKINEVIEIDPLIVEESALADPFFEEFNLIAKIQTNTMDDITRLVNDKILPIEGVIKTKITRKYGISS